MKTWLKYISISSYILIIVIAYFVGDKIKASDQSEIYKQLLSIASVIFAVMGAWLSLLKVELESGIDNAKSDDEGDQYIDRAKKLVNPMTASAVIIFISIIYFLVIYILKTIPDAMSYKYDLRRFSFILISLLCIWQLHSVASVLFSGVDFLITLSRSNKDKIANRRR
jgi:hypothetical protein